MLFRSFLDLESPFSMVTEPAIVREEYLREFNRHRERLREGCLEFNTDHRQIVTDQDCESVLAAFLTERAQVAASGGR